MNSQQLIIKEDDARMKAQVMELFCYFIGWLSIAKI
jgi:hypothetical protein